MTPVFMAKFALHYRLCRVFRKLAICGAKPSEMNRPDVILKKPLDAAAVTFRLSPLHSWSAYCTLQTDLT